MPAGVYCDLPITLENSRDGTGCCYGGTINHGLKTTLQKWLYVWAKGPTGVYFWPADAEVLLRVAGLFLMGANGSSKN